MKYSILAIQLTIFCLFAGCVGNGGQGSLFKPDSIIDTNGNFQGCVSGDPIDSSRVRVNFAWPSGASEMDIYRNGSLVATFTDQSITNYIDVNLQEGGSYQYRCDAKINGIFKQGTNVLNVSPINVNPPLFTGIVSATAKANDPENDSITVAWNPASSSGPLVSYYKIYAKPGCSMVPADFNSTPTKTSTLGNLSVDIDGIGDEIPFSFAVRACTENDVCDENTTVKYTTPVCLNSGLPDTGAPKTIGVSTAVGLSGYRVQLTAPWDYGKGAVQYRYIYVSTTSATTGFNLVKTQVVTDLGNPNTTIILSSMLENTTYYFKIIDEDPSGNSNNNSTVISYTTGDLTAPLFNGVANALVGTPADTKINLSWVAIEAETLTHPEGASNYLIYTNYVDFSPSASDPANACEAGTLAQTIPASNYVSGEAVTYIFTSLPRKIYSICVKAVDAAGNISSDGEARVVTTRDLTPPQFFGIQSLTYDAVNSAIATTWNPSSSSDITSYKLKIWKNNFVEPVDAAIFSLNPLTYAYGKSLINSELAFTSNDVIYAYVNACDDADLIPGGTQNCTLYATPLTRSLPDVDPPANFGGIISASSTANGAVTVEWANPGSLTDYSGFKVYSSDTSNNLTWIGTCPCTVAEITCPTTCSITNLNANRTFKLHVRAYDSVGNLTTYLDPSNIFSNATTLDTVAPQFTSIISYADVTDPPAHYELSWAPGADNQYVSEPGAKIAYRLYRKTGSDFQTSTPYSESNVALVTTLTDFYPAQTTNLTYTQLKSDLEDANIYYYRVCAQDTSGVDSFGNFNINCVPTSTVINTPDITEPRAIDFAHTRTSQKQKKWAITFKMDDNLTANANLTVKVYRKSSANASDLATTSDTLLSQSSSPASQTQYTLAKGTSITDTTTIGSLTGPRDASTYLHYLVRIQDATGNSTDKYLSLYSDNQMTISSVIKNEILKAGSEWILINGTGFSLGEENVFNVDTRVDLGGYSCTSVKIVNSTKILCKTPSFSSPQQISVSLINPEGSSVTSPNAIAVKADATATASYCDDGLAWPRCVNGTTGAGCSGNSANPYLICQESDFTTARTLPATYFNAATKHFVLGNHIDFSASTNYSNFGTIYAGTSDLSLPKFDGKNHFLINKTITGGDDTGLFSTFIGTSARPEYVLYIKDLGVYGLKINNFTASRAQVGGLIGTVSNAGLKFENITMVVDITSNFILSQVGGLFGYSGWLSSDNKVINSWVKMNASFISTTYNSYSSYIGGIAGNASVNIINSSTEGSIFDANGFGVYIGGLVGWNRRSTLACNPAHGETDSSCGIIGSSSSMKLLNLRAWSGGLVGYYDVSNSTAQNLGIHRSYFNGRLEYSNSQSRLYNGGLVGYLYVQPSGSAEITKSYAAPEDRGFLIKNYTTPVALTSDYVGGLVGNLSLGAGTGVGSVIISESYSKGIITSESSGIGGLVGRAGDVDLTIANSYSENTIRNTSTIAEYIGGLVGMGASTASVALNNNYFAGQILTTYSVTTNSDVGPLIGRIETTTVYSESHNYFDRSVCPAGICLVNGAFVSTINGAQGRETAAMQSSTDYATNFTGFDFSTIWYPPLANPSDYPRLRNSPPTGF